MAEFTRLGTNLKMLKLSNVASRTMSVERTIPGKTMRSFLKALALGVGTAGLVILVGFFIIRAEFTAALQSSAPTDETLDANFRAHRASLESLLEMSRADRGVIRIANDFTWLDTDSSWSRPEDRWGISLARWDQYRQLFREAGLRSGILQDHEDGITYFLFWTRGLMTNGTSKGYAYSENDLTPIVSSLDDHESWPKGKRVLFQKLDGNWYLFWSS